MGTMITINGRMVDTANKKQLKKEKEIRAQKLAGGTIQAQPVSVEAPLTGNVERVTTSIVRDTTEDKPESTNTISNLLGLTQAPKEEKED